MRLSHAKGSFLTSTSMRTTAR